jgi:hypothetical protein
MKAHRILPLLAAASLLVSIGAKANDIEPGKEYYTAIKTRTPIVIDGNLSEWGPAQLLADPRFYVPKGSGTNNPPTGELVFFEVYNGGTGRDLMTTPRPCRLFMTTIMFISVSL